MTVVGVVCPAIVVLGAAGTSRSAELRSADDGGTWSAGATYTTIEGDPDVDESAVGELDGGWIEPDLTQGFDAVRFRAHPEDRADGVQR